MNEHTDGPPVVRTLPGTGMVYRQAADGGWYVLDYVAGTESLHGADVAALETIPGGAGR